MLLVVSIILSRLGSSLLFPFLVWYVFLLLPLFAFSCSRFCGSLVVIVCFLFLTFLVGVLSLYHSFDLPYNFPITRTSSGPNRSFGLRIVGRSIEKSESRQTGGRSGCLAAMVNRAPQGDLPSLLDKGKGKISEIRFPSGSEYLKAIVKYEDAVGLSRVEPLYEKTFVSRYRPPSWRSSLVP